MCVELFILAVHDFLVSEPQVLKDKGIFDDAG